MPPPVLLFPQSVAAVWPHSTYLLGFSILCGQGQGAALPLTSSQVPVKALASTCCLPWPLFLRAEQRAALMGALSNHGGLEEVLTTSLR